MGISLAPPKRCYPVRTNTNYVHTQQDVLMTITGPDYLLRLSSLAVTFVGFSSIVVALRRALGAELSDLHMYFVRLFIEGGLYVAALGLLPTALSFTGLAESTIWRLSSAAAALFASVYLIIQLRRRHRVTPGPVPFQASFNYAITNIATLALWANTIGLGFQPSAAPYALALTWFLVVAGWIFLQNLELFILQPPSR